MASAFALFPSRPPTASAMAPFFPAGEQPSLRPPGIASVAVQLVPACLPDVIWSRRQSGVDRLAECDTLWEILARAPELGTNDPGGKLERPGRNDETCCTWFCHLGAWSVAQVWAWCGRRSGAQQHLLFDG